MSDYETNQRRRNIAVGIFVLLAICSLIWLIFKFGDMPTIVSKIDSFRVFVRFSSAPGVQKDTPVRFCGYQVGRVTRVEPPKVLKDLKTGQFYHQSIIVLSINKKYSDIPSNVEVKLMTRGLGSSYIELTVDPDLPFAAWDPNQPETIYLVDAMPLQGSTGMTSEFFPAESQKKLDELISGLNALINNANDILGDKENKKNFKTALEQATLSLEEFRKFSAVGATTLKNTDTRMEKIVTAMISTSEELSKMMAQMRVILGKVDSGEGTLGKIINDGHLYENLIENTQQIQLLLQELSSFTAKWSDKGVPIKLK